jgi:chitosanase
VHLALTSALVFSVVSCKGQYLLCIAVTTKRAVDTLSALCHVLLLMGVLAVDASAAPNFSGLHPLTPRQQQRAESLTSLFESDSIHPCYACVEVLGDGRGVTAGRIGFTSATGDLLLLVQRLTAERPTNSLARYLPRLNELAASRSNSIASLEGIAVAWQREAKQVDMRAIQDALYDELYWQPSFRLALKLKITSALGIAILGDSMVQHGDGDDPDGVFAIAARTTKRSGGTPGAQISEAQWLRTFLSMRRADLAHAYDPDTREVWAASVTRVDVLRQLLDDGKWDLNTALVIHTGGYDIRIP